MRRLAGCTQLLSSETFCWTTLVNFLLGSDLPVVECKEVLELIFPSLSTSNSCLEWLFQHAVDMPVVTTSSKDSRKHDPSKGSMKSTYRMVNSPLVSKYIGMTSQSVTTYGVNMSLSHLPERPLTTLPESEGFHSTKPR